MSATVSNQPPAPLPAPDKERRPDKTRRVATWSCLLVSGNKSLLSHMRKSAAEAGWTPVVCTSLGESIRAAVLNDFPLSVIDISSAGSRPAVYDDLVGRLRSSAGNLVVICDRDANADGELWSREQGAWMYLPSVDEQSDLARICREARTITEKLRGPAVAVATAAS